MKTLFTLLLIILTFMLLTSKTKAQNNEYTILMDFAGSGSCFTPICPIPAAGQTYETVSIAGLVSYPFQDPLIGDDVPRIVSVTYFGDCVADLEISINSHVIGTGSVSSSCECLCDESGNQFTVHSAQFVDGIPGYVYGGENLLNINYSNIGANGIVRNFYAEIVYNDPTLSSSNIEDNIDSLQIIPNPASDYFEIANLKDNATVVMFDASGKKIRELQIQAQTKSRIDTNQFNKGLYFVEITSNNKTLTKKLVIN